jgi:hypothetical protein
MLKIAISGIHGSKHKVFADRLCKVLKKNIDSETELRRVPTGFDSDLREDLEVPRLEEIASYIIIKEMTECPLFCPPTPKGVAVFERAWFDAAIYPLVAKAVEEGETKPPKRAKLEHEIIRLTEKAAGSPCNYSYDIIIFNRLPKRQYELPVINDPLYSQTKKFRNFLNDFFCSLYTPCLKQRSELLPHTRIVINENPFGCKRSVSMFMRNLVGNEILPAIC